MKTFLQNIFLLSLLIIVPTTLGIYFENQKDPYELGTHWNYTIVCENGFIYKEQKKGIIQVLNSDGTPLKCGNEIY